MKQLIFYICIFALVSYTIAWRRASSTIVIEEACLTENGITLDDMFSVDDLVHNRHKEPGNEQKAKTHGCVLQCTMQKQGFIDGSEYKKKAMFKEFSTLTGAQPGEKIYQETEKCVNDTTDMVDKCDKVLNLMECYVQAEENVTENRE